MNLQDIADALDGKVRISRRKVPHAVIRVRSMDYSVVWFRKTNIFRVFWPYPADVQERRDFDTPGKVIAFLVGKRDE